MNIKTITTTEGVNEVDFGSNASRFYWFRNVGTTAVHVSGKADIVAGADGVAELAAGDSVCIETLSGKVYVLGAGKVQIHNTGDKFCPFKNAPAQSGGEAVDAYTKSESDAKYAQKTDIPSSLPANGGNADTVGGLYANDFTQIIDFGDSETDTKTAIGQPGKTTIYRCIKWTDYPSECYDGQGTVIAINYNGAGIAGVNTMWVSQIFITPHGSRPSIYMRRIADTNVGNWEEISTTPIKKITFPSVATNAGGGGALFLSDFGTPITIACTSRADTQCTPFFSASQWLVLAKDAATLDPIPAGSYSFDVWYI